MPSKLNTNAQKWLDALRSGDYKRGRFSLRRITDDGESLFCCLGVACDLYREEVGGSWGPLVHLFGMVDKTHDIMKFTDADNTTAGGFLSPAIERWLGFDPNNSSGCLVKLNDREDVTFEQIANYIEYHQKELFNA